MFRNKKIFHINSTSPRSLSRKTGEMLIFLAILCCAATVFYHRIPSQQTLHFDDGAISYKGYVLSNKMSGVGSLTFENGDHYEGEFKNGIFHGKGTFTAASGWTYIGNFENGLAHGQGKLTTESKTVYEGTFKQGIYQHEN